MVPERPNRKNSHPKQKQQKNGPNGSAGIRKQKGTRTLRGAQAAADGLYLWPRRFGLPVTKNKILGCECAVQPGNWTRETVAHSLYMASNDL